jgi:ABC-type sugar transport system substrate-binding protein
MMNRHVQITIGRLFVYLLVITVVTGCDPSSPRSASLQPSLKDKRIVFIGPSNNDLQWPGVVGGARRYLSAYSMIEVEYLTPSDNLTESLLATIREALAKKPNVIVVYGRDSERMEKVAKEVISTQVWLVTAGTKTDVAGVFGHVQEDVGGAAELLGRNLDRIAAEKKSYFLVHCKQRSRDAGTNYERFMGKAREYHGITLLEERDICEDGRPPAELIREMFGRFPNAGFIVALDAVIKLPGMLDSVLNQNAGFAALNAAPALWRHVLSGKALALAGINDGELGAAAAELAVAALAENRDSGTFKLVKGELVTAETLPDFMKRYADATGLEVQALLGEQTATAPASQPADRP